MIKNLISFYKLSLTDLEITIELCLYINLYSQYALCIFWFISSGMSI